MNIDIQMNKIEHEDLLSLYNKTKDFISYLDDQINNSEVERAPRKVAKKTS